MSTRLPDELAAGLRAALRTIEAAPYATRARPVARRALHRLAAALEDAGWPRHDIAAAVGVHTSTARAWIRHGHADEAGPATGLDLPTPRQAAGNPLTLNEFSRETSVDTTTIVRWSRDGLLPLNADARGWPCLTRADADAFLAAWPTIDARHSARWLTTAEACRRSGLDWKELDRLMRRGEIEHAWTPGRQRRIHADTLQTNPTT